MVNKVDFQTEESRDHSKIKEVLGSSQLIEELVSMNEKYQGMVRNCFKGQALFERARHTAFETFLNKDRENTDKISMSEILAVYTDGMLRKGGMKDR